jgi:diaminopimelate epimerase
MTLTFSKYQGTGNDFILIDNRNEAFRPAQNQVQQLCDRKFGIGADGLILIENHPTLDYKMIYFNADGSQSLCGNGSRCGFAFAQSLGITTESATFETTDGTHEIKSENDLIHFQLYDVNGLMRENDDWYVNTGSPHYIKLVEDTESIDVVLEGRKIRNLPIYSSQNGTNVNFAQLLQDRVKIRTYERGVEDETLSCGTGATGVALVAGELGFKSPIRIETKGGSLFVSFERNGDNFTNIWLAGPAKKVFEGTISI